VTCVNKLGAQRRWEKAEAAKAAKALYMRGKRACARGEAGQAHNSSLLRESLAHMSVKFLRSRPPLAVTPASVICHVWSKYARPMTS